MLLVLRSSQHQCHLIRSRPRTPCTQILAHAAQTSSHISHDRLTQEDIKHVQTEKESAQRKNTQLRLQHEAVKVPKVEDYIQQKAEQYELEKAAANWKRKVEIAEGQKKIVLQQLRNSKRTM